MHLRREYEKWWEVSAARAQHDVRMVLGNAKANPVTLSSHDRRSPGAQSAWNQRQIRQGQQANGRWLVEVERASEYQIELRRWPMEVAYGG